MALVNNLITWTTNTFAPLGSIGLFILAFIESSFFPVPPDVLLIILSLSNPELSLWYALVCTVGSVLGGLFGYSIGVVGKKAILERMFSQEKIDGVHNYFHKYDAWAIFIAAFTPIPYKVFTIAAGVFRIELVRFTVASLIGRGLRFFIIATMIMLYGKPIVDFIDQYLGIMTVVFTIIIILVGFFLKRRNNNFISDHEEVSRK